MTKQIATYGTLREGFYNFYKYGEGAVKKISTHTVEGIVMYYSKDVLYPRAIRGDGSTVMEIVEVSDDTYKSIKSMELEAGYVLDTVRINNKDYEVFLSDKSQLKGFTKAADSDWKVISSKIFDEGSKGRYHLMNKSRA
jgi:gamma-glutamylcyclotransferase (GGCT)/AIG2-like uncharacterized protein YtfP